MRTRGVASRAAATIAGSRSSARARGSAHALPGARSAAQRAARSVSVSPRHLRGVADHDDRPHASPQRRARRRRSRWTAVSKRLRPPRDRRPSRRSARRRTPSSTSGWAANHANTSRFQRPHCDRRGSRRSRSAFCSGQLECVIETPRQPFAWATCSNAPRQCPAWLSPTSATIAAPRRRRSCRPAAASRDRPARAVGQRARLRRSRPDRPLERPVLARLLGSRAAAPKHVGPSRPRRRSSRAPAAPRARPGERESPARSSSQHPAV